MMTTAKTSKATKPATKRRTKTAIEKVPDQDMKAIWASTAFAPEMNGAAISYDYANSLIDVEKTSLNELALALNATTRKIADGDLRPIEKMLLSQATALQSIFTSLARRASRHDQLKQFEALLSLGLKAQSQSRATLQALVEGSVRNSVCEAV